MNRYVVVVNVGEDKMRPEVGTSLRNAAKRWGASYLEITKRDMTVPNPQNGFHQKLQAFKQVPKPAHVVYFDWDVLVRHDCPNLFDLVGPERFAMASGYQPGFDISEHIIQGRSKSWLNSVGWEDIDYYTDYLQGGVMVFNTELHAQLFHVVEEAIRHSNDPDCWMADELAYSAAVKRLKLPFYKLDNTFNRVGKKHWDSWQPIMDDYIWHFSGDKYRNEKLDKTRWWESGPTPKLVLPNKGPIWILGTHRSGSSLVAAIAHKLGAHIGHDLVGFETFDGLRTEAASLVQTGNQAFPFPTTERAVPSPVSQARLFNWVVNHRSESQYRYEPYAGKYPTLGLMIPDLLAVAPDSRFIWVQRPLHESNQSLASRPSDPQGTPPISLEAASKLNSAIDTAIRQHIPAGDRTLEVEFHRLLKDPKYQVERISKFLGVGWSKIQEAESLISPAKPKFVGAVDG